MTKFSFKAYDNQGKLLFTGCDSVIALCLESMGYEVKRFWNGVLI
jgi:hypothetical protein